MGGKTARTQYGINEDIWILFTVLAYGYNCF